MNPRHQAVIHQQQRTRRHASSADAYAFFNLLTCPELFDRVESLLPVHRERLFPPTETLSMFMAQALSTDRSCQRAVDDLVVKQLHGGLKPCSTHTGGYCRARQRLPVEMVSSLVRGTGNLTAPALPRQDSGWAGRFDWWTGRQWRCQIPKPTRLPIHSSADKSRGLDFRFAGWLALSASPAGQCWTRHWDVFAVRAVMNKPYCGRCSIR